MKKIELSPADYAGNIIREIPKGVLLNSKAGGKVNSMVIGWGTFGTEWGVPIFAAYVRLGRCTRTLLDENPEFTVSIPLGEMKADRKKVMEILGGTSGRDCDKIAACGLTLCEPEVISVPGICEFPLTLECRVVHRQVQELENIDGKFMRSYPQDVPGDFPMANRDPHVQYYGEIVKAYIIR